MDSSGVNWLNKFELLGYETTQKRTHMGSPGSECRLHLTVEHHQAN